MSEIIIAATLQTIFFGQLFSSLCEYLSEWLALWRRTSLPVAGVADSRQTATAVAKAAPLGVFCAKANAHINTYCKYVCVYIFLSVVVVVLY